MPPYTKLFRVDDVDTNSLLEQIQINLIEYFNYGLLEAGGYTDITRDDAVDCKLIPVEIPGQPNGRLWQALNRHWVWEGGLESTRQPRAITGIYVNGQLYPTATTTDTYKHKINYPQGQVVFDSPLPLNSLVQAEYSYRWVKIYDQDVPWFRDIIFDSFRYEIGIPSLPDGMAGLMKRHAIQLPAIVIESISDRRMIPKQLGDYAFRVQQSFLFHILAEFSPDRDFLIDAIMRQKDRTIYLFDTNKRARANKFPLDPYGSPIANAMKYPQLVELPPAGFRWKKCQFVTILGQETSARLPLFRATLRLTVEVDD